MQSTSYCPSERPYGLLDFSKERLVSFFQRSVASYMQKAEKRVYTVLDCTCGNGHDSLFVCQCLEQLRTAYPHFCYQVLAFDVQTQGLEESAKRLAKHFLESRVQLIHSGHEDAASYVDPQHMYVTSLIFNLGYLPGSDKSRITQAESTIQALSELLVILEKEAAICVHAYAGHTGGHVELCAVEQWFTKLPYPLWRVLCLQICNKSYNPEQLFFASRC